MQLIKDTIFSLGWRLMLAVQKLFQIHYEPDFSLCHGKCRFCRWDLKPDDFFVCGRCKREAGLHIPLRISAYGQMKRMTRAREAELARVAAMEAEIRALED